MDTNTEPVVIDFSFVEEVEDDICPEPSEDFCVDRVICNNIDEW